MRLQQLSCCHPPPAQAEQHHLTCDQTDLVPSPGSSLIPARSMAMVPTIVFAPCGIGEAPLCCSFSVWEKMGTLWSFTCPWRVLRAERTWDSRTTLHFHPGCLYLEPGLFPQK